MSRLFARFATATAIASAITYAALHAGDARLALWVPLLSVPVVALALSLPLIRRIRALEEVATKMTEGDFRARYESHPGGALASLGTSLNQLADRIGQLLSDQRDLMRTVAHEVRAPVSRMRFRIEMLEAAVRGDDSRHASGLVGDLAQIDSLFEELLTYVAFDEFDQERPELQTSVFIAAEAIAEIVSPVSEVNPNMRIVIEGDREAEVVANPKLFRRAVSNVVRNATAYGRSKVRIEVRSYKKECVVDVQDDGPGIPEIDRARVLKPFVRLDGGQQKARGTGLGLAIVNRIMRLHRGALHIVAAPRGGTSCQLVWRRAAELSSRADPNPDSPGLAQG